MNELRRIIQRLLLESYELTQDDIKRYNKHSRIQHDEDFIRKHADLRGIGIQSQKNIERDKEVMRQWHGSIKDNPKFVELFTKGKIQILHSLTYEGYHSEKPDMIGSRGGQGDSTRPFTRFVKNFGKRSRDQISCIAANAPIGADPMWEEWSEGNAEPVYTDGYGFLMKGYPAFVAEADVMSQTLSAIPQSLKDFHKNSGQVKRAGSMSYAVDPRNWLGADEVILDNWQIIGVYISEDYLAFDLDLSSIYQDAKRIGVPVYKMDPSSGKLERI